MTIDETIKREEEIAEGYEKIKHIKAVTLAEYYKYADEHRQLAEWLKELKQLREQTRWTPVSERLPEEGKTVIASTKYGVYPEAKYTKEYGWEWAYESGADYWRELDDVEAWMPLPKRYEPQEETR